MQFVNTNLLGQRGKVLLPEKGLKELPNDYLISNIFKKSNIDQYRNRPDKLFFVKVWCLDHFCYVKLTNQEI